MKRFIYQVFIMLLLGFTKLFSQEVKMQCFPAGQENIWAGQIGGYTITSTGTLNVLFIFAQFPDDNFDVSNSTWVKGQSPTNMQNWIDQSWSTNPKQGSMTHYFNEMSFNKFKFIGKTLSVITPHTRQWYLDNKKSRGDIHKEIIQQVDQSFDFAQFDNWDFEGEYNHINRQDGIVDMVIVVWRNIAHEYPTNPIDSVNIIYNKLDMGSQGTLGGSEFTVDNGLRKIKTGFWPNFNSNIPAGSGVTVTDWFTGDMFIYSIHEFAHYLMGGNSQHNGHGFWGMLSGWGFKSYMANSYERYRLGWINLVTIQKSPDQTIQNATLPDFLTTGIAYRFVIDDNNSQYFYIENHQNHSRWKAPNATIENGIYILRQDASSGDNKFIQCLVAEGRFVWTVNQVTPNPWGAGNLPVFKKMQADRVNGYHDLEDIPWVWNNFNKAPVPIHFTENDIGQPVLDVKHNGDGNDAFRIGYNEIWSPYSNPNSQSKNKIPTPFGIKLNSISNGVYSIDIYVNKSIEAPPSKPQNLKYTPQYGTELEITWDYNIEPDIASYEVYRYGGKSGAFWSKIKTTNLNRYIDKNFEYSNPDFDFIVKYKIRAVDTQNKFSVFSDLIEVPVNSNKKISIPKELEKSYQLFSNYPNPFNPTTTIIYSIKDAGLVSIKVYDILGSEVAELVNENKEAGYYSLEFNASELPSGFYIYKLQTGDFVSSKKMILLK